MHLQFHSNHIIAYNDFRAQHIRIIVIILVQGAAIKGKSSVQCAVSFKVIPLAFLLLTSVLLMAEILHYCYWRFGQLTGLFIRLKLLCDSKWLSRCTWACTCVYFPNLCQSPLFLLYFDCFVCVKFYYTGLFSAKNFFLRGFWGVFWKCWISASFIARISWNVEIAWFLSDEKWFGVKRSSKLKIRW